MKNNKANKLTNRLMPQISKNTRQSSSISRRQDNMKRRDNSALSYNPESAEVHNFNDFLNNNEEKEIERLQNDIHRIESKIRLVETPDNFKKLENLIKAKEIECNQLEKKVRTLKNFVQKEDSKTEQDIISDKRHQIKQIAHLQKEIKHFDDLHKDLQIKISKKDETLKKHCELVLKLYEKYEQLCEKLGRKKEIRVTPNELGLVDVLLPQDMKLSSKISKKKIEAERNLEKMEKISTYQKKFAERVMKKEIPNLLQWMERQRDFHFEIKKKIEKCEELYQKYRRSKHTTPIDDIVFKKFENLRKKYKDDYIVDRTNITKIEELINYL